MTNRGNLDIDKINHMDIANQINNKWERDTILAFINKLKDNNFAIRFKNKDKFEIKKKYINLNETQSAKRHNNKIVNLIFAFLIFKILEKKKAEIKDILICPDHRPSREVHHYIQKLSYEFSVPNLTEDVDISFMNRKDFDIKRKTPAHRLASKILKGKKRANIIVNLKELDTIIPKLL